MTTATAEILLHGLRLGVLVLMLVFLRGVIRLATETWRWRRVEEERLERIRRQHGSER
jgi:cytochrome b561